MLPGSLYYHFATKEALLAAVYAEGVRRISAAVTAAVAGKRDPWERLEAACIAHLEALLRGERLCAGRDPRAARRTRRRSPRSSIELRDGYERLFVELVAGAAARARHRPARLAAHAARRAQLDADLVLAPGDAPAERRDTPRTFVRLLRRPAARAARSRMNDATSARRSSSPRSASTATTAAAASSPRTCATPAWR